MIVDVALGMLLVYFALASVCSFVHERIASLLSLRQRNLYRALQGMLDGNVDPLESNDGFFRRIARDLGGVLLSLVQRVRARPNGAVDVLLQDPLLKALRGRGWFGHLLRKSPSYIPREYFVEAAKRMGHSLGQGLSEDAFKIVNQFDDKQLGDWFDATMERSQGWYRRQTQVFLIVIATVIVVFMNIDSLQIANTLIKNGALREIVALQAQSAAGSSGSAEDGVEAMKKLIEQTGLELAFQKPTLASFMKHGPGWLISILAAAAGAPFWFDLLSKLSPLRGEKTPQKKEKQDD